jgi:hypothetical protein
MNFVGTFYEKRLRAASREADRRHAQTGDAKAAVLCALARVRAASHVRIPAWPW